MAGEVKAEEEAKSLDHLSSAGEEEEEGHLDSDEAQSRISFQSSLSDDESNAKRDAMQRRLVYIDVPVGMCMMQVCGIYL